MGSRGTKFRSDGRVAKLLSRASNGSDLAATSSAAKESIAAVGLESRHADSGRHLDVLENLSRSGIDTPELALVIFPGAVPQIAIGPRHSRDEAVRLDRTQDRPGLRVDLVNLPVAILSDPQRAFAPGQT